MTTTFTEARDEINSLFFAKWKAETAAIVGYVPEVLWHNVQSRDIPNSSKYWARVSQQAVLESQTTLSTCEGKPGQKRYTADGLVFVQIFAPKQLGNSAQFAGKLAEVARNAFRGKSTPGKVWFRNARIIDIEPEDQFYRFNVVAEFQYDELG